MISSEKEIEILRLFKAEGIRGPCSLGRLVGVHPDAARRVLVQAGLVDSQKTHASFAVPRESMLSPFAPVVDQALSKYPNICASRIFGMLKERGYKGVSQGHVRRFVNQRRPREPAEAFLRLSFLPGEQVQVDWAHFGLAGDAYPGRKLSAFVMTLAYSRHMFLRFFLSMRMREFLQGFVEGFEFFGGVPRAVLIDNLKSGVTERAGDAVRFNETFLALSAHYAFEPKAAGVRRGNEKGRVERSIRYIRDSFFTGRTFASIEELNEQARVWCLDAASLRPWRDDRSRNVCAAFDEEKGRLLALPAHPYPCLERTIAKVGKQPYVWFDGNEYSVPHTLAQAQVEIVASETALIITGSDSAQPAATHVRSYGRREIIETGEHLEALRRSKPGAKKASGQHRLISVVPNAAAFIEQLGMRGENIGGAIGSLLRCLETHGADAVKRAVAEVLASGSCTLRAVHFALRRHEVAAGVIPDAEPASTPERFAHLNVTHHDMSTYDRITGIEK